MHAKNSIAFVNRNMPPDVSNTEELPLVAGPDVVKPAVLGTRMVGEGTYVVAFSSIGIGCADGSEFLFDIEGEFVGTSEGTEE